MKKFIKQLLRESLRDEEIQQYIDVIDTLGVENPNSEKYIKILKDKFGYDYVDSETRYAKENEVIDSLSNKTIPMVTPKGLEIELKTFKTPNLNKSLTIKILHNSQIIGSVGFNIDLSNNTLYIGGAKVNDEYQRKGVYSSVIDFVEKIARDNNLNIIEGGRSDAAKAFWKNR